MFVIGDDHWIVGVRRRPIAGGSLMSIRRFLVQHFTAGWGADTSIAGWIERGDGVCAHIIIDRDGTVTQCRPFNRTCGHAGKSKWRDPKTGVLFDGLNACSIGIELANCGDLQRETYPSTCGPAFSGKPIPRLTARHKNGGHITKWEVYPVSQMVACEQLSKALVARYNLDDVIGHDDCSPSRKSDPGPAFPMLAIREACGFVGMPPKLKP